MSRPIESLEARRLFHAEIAVAINFAPLNAPRAPGFLTDYGSVYDVRRGGLSYGWSSDATANAVDRNATPVQRNDTFIAMQQGGNKTWNLGVENGEYEVYVCAGDPTVVNDRMAITVEGEVAVSGVTKGARKYLEGTVDVNVTDGKLTIANAAWAVNDKIDYVSIHSLEATTADTLDVTASVPTAKESGPVAGRFTVTRGGDIDDAVTVPVMVSGTATNGVDYGRIGKTLTFAAGVSSIDLPVRPVQDNVDESDETVVVTLGAVKGYTLVEPSATVTIEDAASTAHPTTLSWTTKASRPVAASEIFGAAVGDKLYTFGGFTDNTYKPSRAGYAYDVTTNAWSQLASLPVGLTHAGVADDGSRYIYIAGGYPGNGTNGNQTFSTTAVYRYDTQANTFSTLTSLPVARGAGSLALLGGKLYFIGGDDSSRHDVTTVYALDLSNQSAGWVSRAAIPASRNHTAAVAYNGLIYVTGGQTGQDSALTTHADTYRYDPTHNAWSTAAAMPGGRSHITDATFVYDGKLVVLGGQSAYNSPLSSVLEYDPVADDWTYLASLPAPRFSGVGGLINGKFVYTSGYNTNFAATTYVGTLS